MVRSLAVVLTLMSLSCAAETQVTAPDSMPDPTNDDPRDDDPTLEDPVDDEPGDGEDSVADLVSMIRADVDPAFVYEYEQTKFVPPAGRTLLVLGQTLDDINELTAAFPNEATPVDGPHTGAFPARKGSLRRSSQTAVSATTTKRSWTAFQTPRFIARCGWWGRGASRKTRATGSTTT